MAKTATLNIRTDPIVKQRAETLYNSFGITLTDAVNIFLRQSIMAGGLPFEMKQPRYNMQTEAAMQEARDIISGKTRAQTYSSFDSFMTDIRQEMETEDADIQPDH